MRTRLLAAVLAALALVLGTGLPTAAVDTVPGSVSNVRVNRGELDGVLTLRSGTPLTVDRLDATLAGRPVEVEMTPADAARTARNTMLVIDTSGSMGLSGMATVRSAVRRYLDIAPRDVGVGVVSFAATSGVDLRPGAKRAKVRRVVDSLRSRGDTDLYGGVTQALGALARLRGDRSIVLLSDGADSIAKRPAPALRRVSGLVRRTGIRLDVVRFKTDDPAAVGALSGLARAGGGRVTPAGDAAAVDRAFGSVAASLRSQSFFGLTVPRGLTGNQRLELSGVADGHRFRVARTVDLSAVGAGVVPRVEEEHDSPLALPVVPAATWWSDWGPFVTAGLVAFGLMLLCWLTLSPAIETRKQARLRSIETYVVDENGTLKKTKRQRSSVGESAVALGDRVMASRESTSRLLQLINRADLPLTPGEWFVLRVLALVPAPFLFFVGLGLPLALVGLVFGLVLPPLVLRMLASRRARAFDEQLPGVLMIMATSLSSGFGFPQALEGVVSDAADPVAKEFSRAQTEARLGGDLVDALERVADRMGSTTLAWTTMAIRIQRQVGGNLAETLRTTAATLREREALRGQVRALSAEGRLSAVVLILLPVGVFLWMYLMNRPYISLLWTHPYGILMSVVACVLLVGGVFWMRNVVRIEV